VTDDYRVKLDSFEGPMDLLLFLIRKNEVDIHDIPIAQITDQYLSFVAQLHSSASNRIDIDAAGEFLVMAATLTEIKSRMLRRKIRERSWCGSCLSTSDIGMRPMRWRTGASNGVGDLVRVVRALITPP
jgi:hypothetical protein